MQIQKEVISIPKQPSHENRAAPKNARVEKCEIQGGSQEMAVMVKIFINDNSGELGIGLVIERS